jgi:hypothetical protein
MDNDALTTPSDRVLPRIRLTGPASVVAAVPHLLGFNPEHSAILIFMGGAPRQIRLTVRLDLPRESSDLTGWIGGLVRTGRFADADTAILVIVDEVTGVVAPQLPWDELVESAAGQLEDQGVELVDALLMGPDRWWSYLCDNPDCCAPEGTSLEASEALRVQAAFAYEGVSALPSRESIAERLRPMTGRWSDEIVENIEFFADYDFDVDEIVDLLTLSTDYDSALRQDPLVTAQALAALLDVNVRDAVIVGLVGLVEQRGPRGLDHVLDTLCDLVAKSPSSHVAPVASVVAVLAWQCGNGALASVALDRALEAEPEYSLALLIDAMVSNGVPPQLVRAGLIGLQVPHTRAGRPCFVRPITPGLVALLTLCNNGPAMTMVKGSTNVLCRS